MLNPRYVRIRTSMKYDGMVARWFSVVQTHPWENILIMDEAGHEITIAKNRTEEISEKEFFKEKLRGKEIPHPHWDD